VSKCVWLPLGWSRQNTLRSFSIGFLGSRILGGRDNASIEQFQAALDAAPDIVDELTALVKARIRQTAKEGGEGA
jgi:hypothetical protein